MEGVAEGRGFGVAEQKGDVRCSQMRVPQQLPGEVVTRLGQEGVEGRPLRAQPAIEGPGVKCEELGDRPQLNAV